MKAGNFEERRRGVRGNVIFRSLNEGFINVFDVADTYLEALDNRKTRRINRVKFVEKFFTTFIAKLIDLRGEKTSILDA